MKKRKAAAAKKIYPINNRFYFDKIRLLDTIQEYYDNKMDIVGRMDMLYMKQFKHNMNFALKHLGYKPTSEYYSHVLAHTGFGTFGFSDIRTKSILHEYQY